MADSPFDALREALQKAEEVALKLGAVDMAFDLRGMIQEVESGNAA